MSVFAVEIFLVLLGVGLLCLEALLPNLPRRAFASLSLGGTALALLLFAFADTSTAALPDFVKPFHQLDSLALFYKGFALVATLAVLWLTVENRGYLERHCPEGRHNEMFSLPLLVCAGMMWMASAKDLITVFVCLELVTVSFYVLVAFARRSSLVLEAGVKYLILGALSTGVLVYGIAWIYGVTDSMSFAGIAAALAEPETPRQAALLGAAFLLAGLGFKVAAAPFHIWVPDVYQGAPLPVTTFLSVGSKAAGFVVLSRVVEAFTGPDSLIRSEITTLLLIGGAATVLLGSLPALFQTSVKRLLAYSSISHAGYLLLALAAAPTARYDLSGAGVTAFYLGTYLPMTVLGFLVLAILRQNGMGDDLRDLAGLSRRQPALALAATLAFASLAGLPLTAGFMGKLFVFLGLVDHASWAALTCAIIGAAAGFYYYLRPVLAMYTGAPATGAPIHLSAPTRVVLFALAAAIVVIGVYPKPLQSQLKAASTVQAAH
jgi:NADH-quinone oxidoreductase subunit N